MSRHNTELCLTGNYVSWSFIVESQTIRAFDIEQYVLPHIDLESVKARPYDMMRGGQHYIVANNNHGRMPAQRLCLRCYELRMR